MRRALLVLVCLLSAAARAQAADGGQSSGALETGGGPAPAEVAAGIPPAVATPAAPVAGPGPEEPAPSAFSVWLGETLFSTRRWEDGRPRWFFAEQLDAGYVYVRARSFIGYGRPHDRWVGLEVSPQFWMGAVGGFVGLSGAWRFVSLRAGALPFLSLERSFLPASETHQKVDFETAHGEGKARYVTLQAEVSARVPLGPGEVAVLGSLSHVLGVPEGMHVFEESLRVMVAPPWVWRARGGYALHVVRGKQHRVGVVVDVTGVPARDLVQVRVGVEGVVKLSTHLEARLSIIPAVYSKDQLGFLTGEVPELGIRYTFATGD